MGGREEVDVPFLRIEGAVLGPPELGRTEAVDMAAADTLSVKASGQVLRDSTRDVDTRRWYAEA